MPASDTLTDETTTTTTDQPSAFSATLGSGVPDEQELMGLLGRSTTIEQAFDRLVEQHQDVMKRKREEYDHDVRNATYDLDAPAATKAIVAKAAQQKADKQYNDFVRGVRTLTEGDRDEMFRQLHTLNNRAELTMKLFPHPTQLLAVAGLGSAERSTFHAQTAHAGPAELANLANYAIASGNTILAAALMARVDHLPKGTNKPFTASQLATAMVGERHRSMMKAAKTVSATFQRFVNQNRAFERGRVNLSANIADAMRRDALDKE